LAHEGEEVTDHDVRVDLRLHVGQPFLGPRDPLSQVAHAALSFAATTRSRWTLSTRSVIGSLPVPSRVFAAESEAPLSAPTICSSFVISALSVEASPLMPPACSLSSLALSRACCKSLVTSATSAR